MITGPLIPLLWIIFSGLFVLAIGFLAVMYLAFGFHRQPGHYAIVARQYAEKAAERAAKCPAPTPEPPE